MNGKVIEAYDAGAEWICRCRVLVREEDPAETRMDGRELTPEEIAALPEWDRRMLSLLTEDLSLFPMFDGARVTASRGPFTVSRPAERVGEDTAAEPAQDR